MHGLTTEQVVSPTSPINLNYGAGQPYSSAYYIFNPSSPVALNTMIPNLNTSQDGDSQFWIKRGYVKNMYTNVGMFPVYCQTTTLIARKDLNTSLVVIANDDVQNLNVSGLNLMAIPFLSWTVSDEFRKSFKVLKQKTTIMKSMATRTTITKLNPSYYRKAITGDIEGDLEYTFRRGNIVKVVKFTGIPCNWTSEGGGIINQNGLTPIQIRGFTHYYCSYRRMDDTQSFASVQTSNVDFTTTNVSPNISLNPTFMDATDGRATSTNNVIQEPYVNTSSPL